MAAYHVSGLFRDCCASVLKSGTHLLSLPYFCVCVRMCLCGLAGCERMGIRSWVRWEWDGGLMAAAEVLLVS